MSAPASARAAAMPRPMPRPAPVTTATCPVRANILLPSAIASSPTPISGPADAGSKRSAAVLARVPARAPPIPADLRPRPLRAARRSAPGRRRTGQGVSPRRRTLRRSLVAPVLVLLLSSGAWASPPRARIEFWTISLQPFFTGYVQGLIAAYERAHPDVQIRWIDVPPQTIEQKLLAAIAGGVGPEVVNLNTEGTLRMAEARALVDMDGAVPPAARGRYFPNIWSSTRSGGAAYGIPWYVVPNVLAYNRAVFRRPAVAPYPLGPGRVLALPTMELDVPLASRHRREAVDFALYVTDDANQLAFCHLVVVFPSTRAAAADPYFTRAGQSPEDRARAIAAGELGTARDLTVVVPHSDELYRAFREAVEQAFYGRMTPQQALDWAVKEWNARL